MYRGVIVPTVEGGCENCPVYPNGYCSKSIAKHGTFGGNVIKGWIEGYVDCEAGRRITYTFEPAPGTKSPF